MAAAAAAASADPLTSFWALEELLENLPDDNPLKRMQKSGSLVKVLFVVWLYALWWSGFNQLFFMVSVFAFIWGPGLSRGKKSGLSAYSVFNPGQARLLGETSAEEIDAQQRGFINFPHQEAAADDDNDRDGNDSDEEGKQGSTLRSRDANRPCRCGSGKKAKKCCFAVRSRAEAEGSSASAKAGGAAETSTGSKDAGDPDLDKWMSQMEVVATGSKGK
eukprot:TRINITY_DN20335_c0_g1_i1.p1 TRINITY_DN20335_c0_g1~~TRINITY_DN20335_c0_g1_i1.p1  ORF type:complete len:219 (-),score=60.60 TRINITY_DN20335_c0_g1_i1:344-1000(-)